MDREVGSRNLDDFFYIYDITLNAGFVYKLCEAYDQISNCYAIAIPKREINWISDVFDSSLSKICFLIP